MAVLVCGARAYKRADQRKPSIAMASVSSEQISVSRAKPLRGAEGALDTLICSEVFAAIAIDGPTRPKFTGSENDNLPPAAEAVLGAADDLIERDRHGGQHGDEPEQLVRLESFGEHGGEMADAGGGDVELGEQHAEQHAAHAEPHAGEKARDHVRKDDPAQDLPAARPHRAGAGEQDRL